MRRLRFLLLVGWAMFQSSPAFAALAATTVWEIRPANGSDLNGACVDSATVVTDYSQQDAAQLSITDGATTGAGVTTLTSAAAGFTSAMVGNCLHIESGTNFTLGFYQITTFNSSSSVVLDRSPTPAGAGSNGTGKVGGAAKTFESATTTDISDSLVAGNIVWVKDEAWNEAVTFTVTGTAAAPILVEGYSTTRDDDPTGDSRPENARASAAGDGIDFSSVVNFMKVSNIIVSSAGAHCWQVNDTDVVLDNVRGTGCGSDGANSGGGSDSIYAFRSEFDTCTGDGGDSGGRFAAVASSFHDNTESGVDMFDTDALVWNLFYDNTADAVAIKTSATHEIIFVNNTVDGNTGAATDGMSGLTPEAETIVVNNIFSNNGNYGVSFTNAGNSALVDANDYNGNATGARNNFITGANDSTADPTFTDAANDDFSIGTNLKALGLPNATNVGWPLTDAYIDIGAAQRQESGSSATGGGTWGF